MMQIITFFFKAIVVILLIVGIGGLASAASTFFAFRTSKAKKGFFAVPVILTVVGVVVLMFALVLLTAMADQGITLTKSKPDKAEQEYNTTSDSTEAGDIESIKREISDIASAHSGSGDTLLMMVCQEQSLDAVRYLIDEGADVNTITRGHQTALMVAVRYANDEVGYSIVELLVQSGANADINDFYGHQAILSSMVDGDTDMTKLLLDHSDILYTDYGDRYSYSAALSIAISIKNNYSMVQYLLDNGASTEYIHVAGNTALLYACSYSYCPASTVELLLLDGADVHATNNDGATALIALCSSRYCPIDPMIIQLLIDYGSDPSAVDISGNTALDYLYERETMSMWVDDLAELQKVAASIQILDQLE